MLITVIKHTSIIFWGLFIFIKSFNYKPTVRIITLQFIYSIILSFLIILLNSVLPEMVSLIIVLFSCFINKLIIKNKWDIVIISSVICCGISYAINMVSGAILSIILGVLFGNPNDLGFYLLVTFSFFIAGLISVLLFKIRRFKNGFSFLNEKYISLLGILITLIIFQYYTTSIVMARRVNGDFDALILISAIVVAFSAVIIIVWWKTGITKAYRDSLITRENDELYREISEKDKAIAEITSNNTALSRIIHNDNKRIPALENAVRDLCVDYSEEKAFQILIELQNANKERMGIINEYKRISKKLQVTRIASLDIMLSYMMRKAHENNIEFDVFVSGNIKAMTENIIKEEQLRTIIADLLENAIIAVKPCDFRRILFTIGICDDYYEIRVEDSGIDFKEETLNELGKKQTTTHKYEGGSGIGMMEIFEIARETRASLVIKKLPEKENTFTKQISIKFNGKNEIVFDYPSNEK